MLCDPILGHLYGVRTGQKYSDFVRDKCTSWYVINAQLHLSHVFMNFVVCQLLYVCVCAWEQIFPYQIMVRHPYMPRHRYETRKEWGYHFQIISCASLAALLMRTRGL